MISLYNFILGPDKLPSLEISVTFISNSFTIIIFQMIKNIYFRGFSPTSVLKKLSKTSHANTIFFSPQINTMT